MHLLGSDWWVLLNTGYELWEKRMEKKGTQFFIFAIDQKWSVDQSETFIVYKIANGDQPWKFHCILFSPF